MAETSKTYNNRHENLQLYLGLGLVVLVLILNIVIVNPTPYLYSTYKIVISIGTGLISTKLTGFIHYEGKGLKIGGAVAVMIVIYSIYPIAGNQNSIFRTPMDVENCSDSLKFVHLILSDYERIPLDRGDIVEILEITGKQDFGPMVGLIDYKGKNNGLFDLSLSRYNLIEKYPHGAAMFKISNSTTWKQLHFGKLTTNVNSNVSLEFEINDKEKSNNLGFFGIRIKISKGK